MRKPSASAVAVLIALVLYVGFFGVSNWYRQVNMYTAQFDMGNMEQVLWHTIHGQLFQMADPVYGERLVSRTSIHADFLLLIYAPFYALWPDPRTMLTLQVLFVASGAIPLYWIGKKKISPHLGALFAIGYLLYPTLQWAVTFDIHAVVLDAPLLLWAWWAMSERRWWIYGLAAGLALFGKEEAGLVVAAMGVYWLWRPGYRRAALATIVIGLGWSMVMIAWAIPQARNAPGHFALGYYSAFGDTYSGILGDMLRHPWQVIRQALNHRSLVLLRDLFLPLGFLPIFGWPVLLVAVTEFGINLLSSNTNQQLIFFQYMSLITPFVFIATIAGWEIIRRWLIRHHGRWRPERLVHVGTGAVVLALGFGVWAWCPLPGMRHSQQALAVFHASPYTEDVKKIQTLIRPTDQLAVTNNIGAQFAQREWLWSFPNTLQKATAVVVLEANDLTNPNEVPIAQGVDQLAHDTAWTVVYHRDLIWCFRKVSS